MSASDPPRYRLVLFDLDGTLIDSAPDLTTSLRLALGECGLPGPELAVVRKLIGNGQRSLVERALRWAGADPDRPGVLDDMVTRFRAQYSAHLTEQTALYPGVAETLRELGGRGFLQVVATNKPGAWARRLVEALGFGATLLAVLGEDDVGARKPDPRLAKVLCERAGVPASAALFVGDSAIDLDTAAAAGMEMALCTYGYGDAETIAAARRAHGEHDPASPLGTRQRPFVLESLPELLTVPGLRR